MESPIVTNIRSRWKPLVELALWLGLCAIIFSQTGLFDREIPEYRFGANGWPRAICLIMALGAIGQFCSQIIKQFNPSAPRGMNVPSMGSIASLSKRLMIFVFPFFWLYLAPRVGFYLSTPFFVLGMLWLMEVRSIKHLVTVTMVIYATVLLIFTRFFFVALPVGRIEFFYDLNVSIISLARAGM